MRMLPAGTAVGRIGRIALSAVSAVMLCGATACTTTTPGNPAPAENAEPGVFGEGSDDPNVAHYARIRAADPCVIAESDVLKKYGSLQKMKQPSGITQCIGMSGEEVGDVYLFYLDLDVAFGPGDSEGLPAEQIAGRTAYRTSVSGDSTAHRSCTYKIPYEGVDSALNLRVVRTPPSGAPDAPWPEACAAAAEYLESIYPKVAELKPNPRPAPGEIRGQDPCEQKEAIADRFPGWTADSIERPSPYMCDLEFVKADATRSYQVSINFSVNEKPAPTSGPTIVHSEPMTLDGFEGVRTERDAGPTTGCLHSLIIRPAGDENGEDFHIASVELLTSAHTPAGVEDPDDVTFDAAPAECGKAETLTRDVLAGIQN